MDMDKIQDRLHNSKKVLITVAGDYCLDKYLYIDGSKDEPSVETGLTAHQVVKKALYPGASGTIVNNLRALGARVNCLGFIGNDGEGFELLKCLGKTGADTSYMIKTQKLCTNTYMKPIRMENGNCHEINRLDFRNFDTTPKDIEDQIIENLTEAVKISNAVILSDQFHEQDCGVITERVRNSISQLALAYPRVVFYADSRGFIDKYRNVIVKCNHFEAVKCMMPNYHGEITDLILRQCGLSLFRRNKRTVYITLGEGGIMVFDNKAIHVPGFSVEGPIDICGAGDAANAGIVLGLTLGLDKDEAALLGNGVSSITIEQIGVTGTATIPQVLERMASIQNH